MSRYCYWDTSVHGTTKVAVGRLTVRGYRHRNYLAYLVFRRRREMHLSLSSYDVTALVRSTKRASKWRGMPAALVKEFRRLEIIESAPHGRRISLNVSVHRYIPQCFLISSDLHDWRVAAALRSQSCSQICRKQVVRAALVCLILFLILCGTCVSVSDHLGGLSLFTADGRARKSHENHA